MAIYALPDQLSENMSQERRERISRALVADISGENFAEMNRYIDEVLAQFGSDTVLERMTLDEVWTENYGDDTNSTQLIAIFASISVVISLLGLAGLATFDTQQRYKEIAVRKVMGASVFQLLALLLRNFTVILTLSIIPAMALSYIAIGQWLERFAYRTDIGILPFVGAIIIVASASIITLLGLTYKAAAANPVEKLRYE